MNSRSTLSRSVWLMLLSVLLFAVNVLAIRALSLAVPAVDGWMATLFRGAVGLVVVAWFFGRRGLELGHLVSRPLVLARGVVGALGILAFYLTVVELGAARAVVINLSYPMFGSLFAVWWMGESLSPRAWLWLAAGFAGLVLFLAPDGGAGIGPWDGVAVAGAVAAGAVVALIRLLRHSEHTSTIYASQCGYSLLFALVPGSAALGDAGPGALAVLAVAAVVVAAAQLAMTHAYRELTVAQGSSIQMLLPVVTAAGGWACFGERFSAVEWTGAALTLVATWQVIVAPRARTVPPPEPLET